MRKAPIALAVIIPLALLAQANGLFSGGTESTNIIRVIDGDTVELAGGERVRLLGIDTPERGQHLYEEARDWLRARVEGQFVQLEGGPEDRDKYGRLLRHIRLGNTLINQELVGLGFASTYMLEEGEPHYQELVSAEASAREAGLGIWQHSAGDFCIGIHDFRYNSPGDDNDNLNEEYFTLRNKCSHPVELTNYMVRDSATSAFLFPVFTLASKETVTIHSGRGEDNSTDLYWRSSRAVWNNGGDTLLMQDPEGRLLLNYTYQ